MIDSFMSAMLLMLITIANMLNCAKKKPVVTKEQLAKLKKPIVCAQIERTQPTDHNQPTEKEPKKLFKDLKLQRTQQQTISKRSRKTIQEKVGRRKKSRNKTANTQWSSEETNLFTTKEKASAYSVDFSKEEKPKLRRGEAKNEMDASLRTLKLVKPRVRFRERDNEIQSHPPVDRESDDYRTLRVIEVDKDVSMTNICIREKRENDLAGRAKKYTIGSYREPGLEKLLVEKEFGRVPSELEKKNNETPAYHQVKKPPADEGKPETVTATSLVQQFLTIPEKTQKNMPNKQLPNEPGKELTDAITFTTVKQFAEESTKKTDKKTLDTNQVKKPPPTKPPEAPAIGHVEQISNEPAYSADNVPATNQVEKPAISQTGKPPNETGQKPLNEPTVSHIKQEKAHEKFSAMSQVKKPPVEHGTTPPQTPAISQIKKILNEPAKNPNNVPGLSQTGKPAVRQAGKPTISQAGQAPAETGQKPRDKPAVSRQLSKEPRKKPGGTAKNIPKVGKKSHDLPAISHAKQLKDGSAKKTISTPTASNPKKISVQSGKKQTEIPASSRVMQPPNVQGNKPDGKPVKKQTTIHPGKTQKTFTTVSHVSKQLFNKQENKIPDGAAKTQIKKVSNEDRKKPYNTPVQTQVQKLPTAQRKKPNKTSIQTPAKNLSKEYRQKTDDLSKNQPNYGKKQTR